MKSFKSIGGWSRAVEHLLHEGRQGVLLLRTGSDGQHANKRGNEEFLFVSA